MVTSLNQDLTFNILKLKLEEKGIPVNQFKMITSGFLINDEYTNLAYFFSNQYDIETKISVWSGINRSTFKTIKTFSGSIINQIDKAIDYFELCNECKNVIIGKLMREKYNSYYEKAD